MPNSKLSWLCSQTISDEMHDVPLCSLVHKGRHGVEAWKQVGKPKTDTVQGRALKHQMSLVSHTVHT